MRGFKSAIGAIFDFAETVTLAFPDGTERPLRAFIEPEDASSPERPEYLAQGRSDARRYVLLAEASGLDGSERGALVRSAGGEFSILRLERMPAGCWEGVLKRRAGGADA